MIDANSGMDDATEHAPHLQTVVALLIDRGMATVDVATSTLQLAASEAKLALSSAGLLAVCLVTLVVMLPITWLVALATGFAALQSAGLSALASVSILLALQILLCGLIAYTMLRLSRLLKFRRTRDALRSSLSTPDPLQSPVTGP